jgi:plasmid maintenance system antidote protein VapI
VIEEIRGIVSFLQNMEREDEIRAALSAPVNERAQLSSEKALRIEKALGVLMDTLVRMQNSFDIAQARKREGEINVEPGKSELRGRPPVRA